MTPGRHQSHTCMHTEGSMLRRALLGTLCARAEPSSTCQKDGRVHTGGVAYTVTFDGAEIDTGGPPGELLKIWPAGAGRGDATTSVCGLLTLAF